MTTSPPASDEIEREDFDNALLKLNSGRPKVVVRGDDILLSDVAAKVGVYLGEYLYLQAGEVVAVEGGRSYLVSSQQFRSLVERHIIPLRRRSGSSRLFEIGSTLLESEARGILASHQFRERLRSLRRINSVRLPVLRSSGRIELLPKGYDAESQILTTDDCPYSESMGWLVNAHRVLDDAVFAAYGLADPLSNDEIIRHLLELNRERASGYVRVLSSDLPPKKAPGVERPPRQRPSVAAASRR